MEEQSEFEDAAVVQINIRGAPPSEEPLVEEMEGEFAEEEIDQRPQYVERSEYQRIFDEAEKKVDVSIRES